jgi:hypothetical protein
MDCIERSRVTLEDLEIDFQVQFDEDWGVVHYGGRKSVFLYGGQGTLIEPQSQGANK